MKKAKLQLALDDVLLEDALELVQSVAGFVDVIEIGTPLIEREGMRAVRALRQSCPDKEILADTKIMDAGEYAAAIAFEAGADYCTVLGCTDLITIGGCLKAAEKFGRKAVVDMICVDDIEARAQAGIHRRKLHRRAYGARPAGGRRHAAFRSAHAARGGAKERSVRGGRHQAQHG